MKPSAEYIKLCGVADEDTGKYKKSFIGKGELLFMADKIIENNQVTIIGEVASPFVFSMIHNMYYNLLIINVL